MTTALSAAELAARLGGEVVGDGAAAIAGVASLDRAGPGDLSFFTSGKYLDAFRSSRAGVALVRAEHRDTRPGPPTRVVVTDPGQAMLAAVQLLFPPAPRRTGVHSTAIVGAGAVLGADVFLGPHVVIGDGARLGDRVTVHAGAVVGEGAAVGDDSVLHPHVVLYPGTVLGRRVILHAGVRLGVDGFGYVPTPAGHQRIPHVGRCIVEDDVEIGANSTVDRGSVDDTVIGPGTKIDNLVHIGHNCRIGSRCLVMAQVGIAGSSRVEDEAILAGQVGLAGHLTVGRRARLAAQSGVMGDVPAGATWFGYPARPRVETLRATAAALRVARIIDQLEALVARDDSQER